MKQEQITLLKELCEIYVDVKYIARRMELTEKEVLDLIEENGFSVSERKDKSKLNGRPKYSDLGNGARAIHGGYPRRKYNGKWISETAYSKIMAEIR